MKWLKEERGCKPSTCNARLTAIKTFLKYIGSRDPVLLSLSQTVGAIPKQRTIKSKVSRISKPVLHVSGEHFLVFFNHKIQSSI